MFEPKEKEPLLTEELKSIIARSKNPNDPGKNYDDIFRYKYRVMSLLTSDQDLLHALHNLTLSQGKEELNGDAYRDVNIFDFLKLPDLKDEVKNYVCFDVYDLNDGDVLEKRIVFRVVSHKDDYKTDWGIARQDLLALIIRNKLDWSNIFGKTIIKESETTGILEEFYYRDIVYIATTPYNTYNRVLGTR